MDSALTGDVEPLNFAVPAPEQEQFEQDALDLAAIGNNPKWEIVRKYCQERIDFYQNDLGGLDLNNMDLAKVGERFLVCNLVAMELQALLAKVEVTTEAVNESRKSKRA